MIPRTSVNKEDGFKLIMRQPPDYPGEDVPLAFSLYDLYLLGFLHENKWRFYGDATLPESFQKHLHVLWEKLNFSGGYCRDMFTSVPVDFSALLRCHDAMSHYSQRPSAAYSELQNLMFCIIAVVPEAKRFPEWMERLLHLFVTHESSVLGNTLNQLFTNWNKICTGIFSGPDSYEPILTYLTYDQAVASVAVLLVSADNQPDLVEETDDDDFKSAIDGDNFDSEIDDDSNPGEKQFDPDYDSRETDEEFEAEEKEAREKARQARYHARKAKKEARKAEEEARKANKEAKEAMVAKKRKGKAKGKHNESEYAGKLQQAQGRQRRSTLFWFSLVVFLFILLVSWIILF